MWSVALLVGIAAVFALVGLAEGSRLFVYAAIVIGCGAFWLMLGLLAVSAVA